MTSGVYNRKGWKGNSTSFKNGMIPWNKGKSCPELKGKYNGMWKGDDVSYSNLHTWEYRELGRPNKCEQCGVCDKSKKYEWANISGEYNNRDLTDWKRLCRPCHTKFDNILEKAWITRRSKNV